MLDDSCQVNLDKQPRETTISRVSVRGLSQLLASVISLSYASRARINAVPSSVCPELSLASALTNCQPISSLPSLVAVDSENKSRQA